MGTKELNETLTLIARQPGKPGISSACFLDMLDQLDEINRNLQKALYGEGGDNVPAN